MKKEASVVVEDDGDYIQEGAYGYTGTSVLFPPHASQDHGQSNFSHWILPPRSGTRIYPLPRTAGSLFSLNPILYAFSIGTRTIPGTQSVAQESKPPDQDRN